MKLYALVALALLSPLAVQCNDDEWWENTIFYQIYPRSFMDSDGDGIGDLNGITSRLEYIKDLGVDATWMSPIYASPMYDFGYDISDFYAINPDYGTMEDFENLLLRANELEIKIILDFVPNHSSNESYWFEESRKGNEPYRDWYVWEDGVVDEDGKLQPPNNWLSLFRGSAWEYEPRRNQYYLHQFLVGQPDLNYRNEAVVAEMKNVLRFWLEKGVAGFRVDAARYVFEVDKADFGGVFPDEPLSGTPGIGPTENDFLRHIYTADQPESYDMVYQWREVVNEFTAMDGVTRVVLTEAYTNITNTMLYYGDGERLGADVPFNFGLITDINSESSAHDMKYVIDRWFAYMPLEHNANWVIGNHDNNRVATRYGSGLVDGINMLVLLLPGVAITYMGEEIGMVNGYVSWEDTVDPQACNTNDPINYATWSRDPARTPFQWSAEKNAGFSTADRTWLPVADGYQELNVAVQSVASRSHLTVYKDLAALRQEDVFRSGAFNSRALNKNVFAFTRSNTKKTYLVILNMSEDEQTVSLAWFDNLPKKLTTRIVSLDSPRSGGTIVGSTVTLAGKEALVLEGTNKNSINRPINHKPNKPIHHKPNKPIHHK